MDFRSQSRIFVYLYHSSLSKRFDATKRYFSKMQMITKTLQEAQEQLSTLIESALYGEEVVIVASPSNRVRLVPIPDLQRDNTGNDIQKMTKPRSGRLRGTIVFIADDFDAPLDDFKEYMP